MQRSVLLLLRLRRWKIVSIRNGTISEKRLRMRVRNTTSEIKIMITQKMTWAPESESRPIVTRNGLLLTPV